MENGRKTFKAPWDWLLILMTSGVTLLLLGLDYYTPGFIPTLITWSIILGALGFGIGGLFGYVGYFRNSILKGYKAYVTHRDKTVVITTEEEQVVISPDDPEAFVASIEASLGDKQADT